MAGIYVEENRVIHFTRTEEKSSGQSSRRCEICGYQRSEQRGVVKSCIDCFVKGHKLKRFEYNVSAAHFCAKRSGTCSTRSSGAPDVIVERATRMLAEGRGGFGDYDLFENNCESFAVYCATGEAASGQALSLKSKVKIFKENLTGKPLSLENIASTLVEAALAYKIDAIQQNNNLNSSSSEKDQDDKKNDQVN